MQKGNEKCESHFELIKNSNRIMTDFFVIGSGLP